MLTIMFLFFLFFFFNDTATTEIYTLSLHDALPISLLDPQVVELPPGPEHGRRIRVVTQAMESDDRVDHRREDGTEPVGGFEMLEHPAVGRLDCGPPPGCGNPAIRPLENPIDPQEEARPGEKPLRAPGPRPLPCEEQFADPALRLDHPDWLEMRHDRKRHHDRARPCRHRAQAEVQPRRDQHQLRRNARALAIADLSQKCQVKASETIARISTP